MDRRFLRQLQTLWRYRLVRWATYSIVALIATDRAILFATNHFDLIPSTPRVTVHQPVPDAQVPTLRDLRFAADHLRNSLQPVLLPEDAGDDDFAFYDELLSNVETRKDVSWIVLKESGIENALSGVAITWENRVKPLTQYTIFKGVYKEYGIPLTEDEQRLDLRYGFLARVARLRKHFDTLSREGTKKPDTWDSRYVDELLPPANATSGDGDKSDMLALLDVQQQKAQELVDQHLRKYNNALAYFRLVKPPKVLSWVPLTKDAWDRTRKIDIKSGNLHGNKDWKAIYSSWDLDGGPTFWTNPSQSEEDAAIELKLLQKSNEDHSKWQDRKKEYLNTLRDKPLKEEEIT